MIVIDFMQRWDIISSTSKSIIRSQLSTVKIVYM